MRERILATIAERPTKDTKIENLNKEARRQEFTKRQNEYLMKKQLTTEEKQQKAQLLRQKLQDEKVAKAVQSAEIPLLKEIALNPNKGLAQAIREAVQNK